jgi:autotransporter-associated beta strand protein
MRITGGTFSTAGSTISDLLGNTSSGTSSLIIDGGAYISGTSGLAMSATDGGSAVLTVNSGSATITNLSTSASTSTNTVNLNGGTLTSSAITLNSGTNTFNFNGGTLKASASTATFLTGNANTNVYVLSPGAVIDTNGYNVTITKALLTDVVSTGGGLTKNGSGTLAVTGASTYTGATTINNGTLEVGGTGSLKTSSVAINSGGTLLFSGTGGTNNKLTAATAPAITLNGGTLNTGGLNNLDQTVGALTLTASSVIDFAALASGTQSLRFAASNADWTGLTLSIWNWTAGIDHLYFGTSASGLDVPQLSQIVFYGGSGTGLLGTAVINGSGELTPIPEPSTVFALIGLFGIIGWRERKRLRQVLVSANQALLSPLSA